MQGSSQNLESNHSWNQVSAAFLEGRIAEDSIDYGPLCPLEDELHVIRDAVGDVDGLDVLDAGCGGGENAVRFAKLGADVIALDFSDRQLDHARQVAAEAGVDIRFIHSDVTTLKGVADASLDLVLSAHVLPYVREILPALDAFRRVLRPGGRLIASMDHPVRSCFMDEDTSQLTNYVERSYWSAEPRRWMFDGTTTTMQSYDRTVGQWADLLPRAGLRLLRLLEPQTPVDVLDQVFPEDGPLAGLRHIPHTLILVAGRDG